ncbi:Cholesterol 7-alpha-monooxygenase [Tulasnella sp. JGI-2019a]|nr:Cholesterol 7-alpha-monooxygenase [Tulasnella sp. JGI-2019a]KAG9034596.1 Cholesterol 7-alpha-monooxygenase [Tulasnella sp. JGI-2019a]
MAINLGGLEDISTTFFIPLAGVLAVLAFNAHFSGKQPKNRPPLVSYIVPWIGSAVSMGKDPDAFFKQAREKYGSIFAVQAAGTRQYFLTSAADIASVYKNSKSFVFVPIRLEFCAEVFGTSHAAVYGGSTERIFELHHKVLAQNNVGMFTQALARHGMKIIASLKNNIGEKDSIHTTLEAFVHPNVFEVQSAALFGPSFPAMSLYHTFLDFDKIWFPLMVAKLPGFLLKKGIAARDKITSTFHDHLDDTTEEYQAAEYSKVHTYPMTEANPPWSQRDTASNFTGSFWAAQSNMTWAFYWLLALPLHEPTGLDPLVEELNEARAHWLRTNPSSNLLGSVDEFHQFIAAANLPLLEAHLSETLRTTSSSFSIRKVVGDRAVLGGYEFQEGDTLVCNTRAVHQDESVYEDPSAFRPERFLQSEGTEGVTQVRKPLMAFGGGVSQCEGRHFAMRGAKILAALFLFHFDVRLDPSKPSKIEFDMSRIGLGVLHPKTPSHVIVKRRSWA